MNLDDIARKAGVSRATVSRVINKKGYVSPTTRARVSEVIEREGFTPNPAARMLVTQRTRTIGIVIPHLPNALFDESRYFSALLQGITQVTHDRDYGVLLWLEQPGDSENRFYKRILQSRLMDGLLLASTLLDDMLVTKLLETGMPFTMVDKPPVHEDRITYVSIDNETAVINVIRHFVSLGRRKIATITGNQHHIDGVSRLIGYRNGLEAFGIPYNPALVSESDFSFQQGYLSMKKLIGQDFDALFAASDMTALGVLKAMNEVGIRVPEDVALIGFDDLPTALSATPHLTTVHHPIMEKGARAAELLIDMIEGSLTHPTHELLPTYLVIRESCGTPLHESTKLEVM
jgi:LacI family transcriptional regulator